MTTLADSIIAEDFSAVEYQLRRGGFVNDIDEYGFTPLIEAAIANNIEIGQLLLQYHADINLKDQTGNTALHWVAENNNYKFTELLLKHKADPNAYNASGQSVLVMPLLRANHELKKLLLEYGSDLSFAQDFINVKLLGHLFELVGVVDIVSPSNKLVEVDFEGFYLEVTLAIIADSLKQFKNHFAARRLRQYMHVIDAIIEVLFRAARLIKFQQYTVDIKNHLDEINQLLEQEPLIIPVGYEGHAITFIKLGDILVKCDRREDSRLYDNIVIYQMLNANKCTLNFLRKLIYKKQSSEFINEYLPEYLGLQPITELKVPAQISGNCSWANVEACIPVLFFLFLSNTKNFQEKIPHYKRLSLDFFNQWREWSKDRSLQFCLQSFEHSDPIRKGSKAEIMAAILLQGLDSENHKDESRIEIIMQALSPTYDFVLENYMIAYCFEDQSEEGKRFMAILKSHGFKING